MLTGDGRGAQQDTEDDNAQRAARDQEPGGAS